ncbi:MAG: hypothetical protein Q9168_001644 [Polycauliona sp. 1 TL-2023]
MHFSTVFLGALAAIPALSAPAPANAVSMMASAASQWTIKSFVRTCNAANTSCKYSYSIDTHAGAPTPCTYTVTGNPAARASYNNVQCGAYVVSSSWSGQFGPNQGFQTLAVVTGRTIIYPAYKDSQLANGVVVSPDQSYAPQNLP